MSDFNRDLWGRLKASGKGDGRLEIPSLATDVDTGYGRVRYSLGEGGERRLLIPLGDSRFPGKLDETGSLRVSFPRLVLAGKHQRFIDLLCLDSTLDPVFQELVDEILARIADGAEPVSAVKGTFEDFRALLFPRRTTEVPTETLIGLLGEMHVLYQLCERSPDAVNSWVGPHEMRHDFRTEAHAIEVKASRSTSSSEVMIHGIDQLLPPAGGNLLLVKVTLEPTPDGAVFLSELYRSLLYLGVSRQALLERLASLGCADPMDPAWNDRAFTLEAIQAWTVQKGFPRLTSNDIYGSSLPPGVTRIQYALDMAFAGEYLIDERQTAAWLDEMMT